MRNNYGNQMRIIWHMICSVRKHMETLRTLFTSNQTGEERILRNLRVIEQAGK